jgi:hypothetical protein
VTRLGRVLLVAALVALGAGPAWGFVRTKTKAGIPIYWTAGCATATVYLNGFSMMTRDEVAKSIAAAAHAWSPSAVDCTGADGGFGHPSFEIVPTLAPPGAVPPRVRGDNQADGQNIVVFRTDGWEDDFHAEAALALTTVVQKSDGRILDADMEINAFDKAWGNLDPGSPLLAGPPEERIFDLQSAITHEFGHFLGLDHTCHGPADLTQMIDDDGNPVLDCAFASEPVQATVMFAVIDPKDVSKRVLTLDDIAGVCTINSPGTAPRACALDVPDDGCGCAAAPRRPHAGAGMGALAALAAVALARARARR